MGEGNRRLLVDHPIWSRAISHPSPLRSHDHEQAGHDDQPSRHAQYTLNRMPFVLFSILPFHFICRSCKSSALHNPPSRVQALLLPRIRLPVCRRPTGLCAPVLLPPTLPRSTLTLTLATSPA